jgi:hypothetical protein
MKMSVFLGGTPRVLLVAVCLLGLMLTLSTGLLAQDSGEEIVLLQGTRSDDFATLGGEIRFVSLPDGAIRSLALPPQLFPAGSGVTDIVISPDQRYLAVASQPQRSDVANPVAIYDLQGGNCCAYVAPPLDDIAAYELGGFSPDSGRLVLVWVGFFDRQTYAIAGGLMTVDAATGTTLQNLSMDEINAAFGFEFPQPFALLGEWREDGIRFIPNCYACEPIFEGEWAIWMPELNAINISSGEHFSNFFGDVLRSTEEMLYADQSGQFPMSAEPAYLPIPNVIYYLVDQPVPTYETPANGPVIYFNPNQVDLSGGAHWVMDGEAALITPYLSGEWTLLYRDGRQRAVSVAPNSTFLTGTPDGWLMQMDSPNGAIIVLYTVQGEAIISATLGEPLAQNAYVQVLDAPELGTTRTEAEAFPPVAPQFPAASAGGTCPNLLPSRIAVNGTARVTPGNPNRLRSEPSLSGPLIGEIPGGAQFYIYSGPVCDETNGIVWWQVEYGSQIGWTAESQNGTYYVEPVGVG